jgi:hypothetical protein
MASFSKYHTTGYYNREMCQNKEKTENMGIVHNFLRMSRADLKHACTRQRKRVTMGKRKKQQPE